MRTLSTLIKRQIVDNAKYFLVAIIFSIVLIIAIISIILSEELSNLSFNTVILIITAPIFFGIGSYILGVIHVYSDKMSGVTSLLSVLPVTHNRIFLVRLIFGILIIMMLLGPLAITGAILWELLGPPDWLFHNWLGDTFMGLSLASLACYCLGLIAARRAETFATALKGLLLVSILMLLIVIKGFGWQLHAVLLPFLAVSLFRCYQQDTNRLMTNISTGFTALVLLAIPLYFGRNICDGLLVTTMEASAKVSPSGLLSMEIENDPNVVDYSEVIGRINLDCRHRYCVVHNLLDSCHLFTTRYYKASHYLLKNLGIIEYFKSRKRGARIVYSPNPLGRPIYLVHLDEVRGQLVFRRTSADTLRDLFTCDWKDVAEIYAGPEGVSSDPNNTGCFSSPVVNFDLGSLQPWHSYLYPCIVYDRDSRCFYAIDFDKKIVNKGPEIQNYSFYPIDIGSSANSISFSADFSLPSTKRLKDLLPIIRVSSGYLTVVEKSGQINLLNPTTLVLYGPAGFLPPPKTLFGRTSSKSYNLLDFDIDIVATGPNTLPIIKLGEREYLGLIAGSLSRQDLSTSVVVFDKDGKKIKSADSKSTFFNVPGGPVLAITKYIFESLHPPVLALASYFTAYSFDARSTHRALFLMPNSFVAMARDYEGNIFYKYLLVLLLMLPGILFAALLGWRVTRDAGIIGLSNKARKFWLIGTLIFSLPAYITYRLTRPKVTLITCANCGKPRRPDADTCHHCSSKWEVPELIPPKWRVLNGEE